MKTETAAIISGYKCDNLCRFCVNNNGRKNLPEKTTSQIVAKMVSLRKRERFYLELIGCKQSIHPRAVIYLIKTANNLGFKDIIMAADGYMLSCLDYAKALIKAGVTSIIFSIHGHNNYLHDSLTQVGGSFKELLQGINNIKTLGFKKIGSNTTVVEQNYRFLPEIGRFIYNLGIRDAEFIFIDPRHKEAFNNFKKIMSKISEVVPYVRRCLDIGKNSKLEHWRVRYVPLCYFAGYERQISELLEAKYFNADLLSPDFKNYNVKKARVRIGRINTEKCKRCIYSIYCEGKWEEYIKHYGDIELKLKKPGCIRLRLEGNIKRIKIAAINPFTNHPKRLLADKTYWKDLFLEKNFIIDRKSHLAVIAGIKNKIFQGERDIEPIIVEFTGNKSYSYNLVDGFCRYMAFKQLGYKTIKCELRTNRLIRK